MLGVKKINRRFHLNEVVSLFVNVPIAFFFFFLNRKYSGRIRNFHLLSYVRVKNVDRRLIFQIEMNIRETR